MKEKEKEDGNWEWEWIGILLFLSFSLPNLPKTFVFPDLLFILENLFKKFNEENEYTDTLQLYLQSVFSIFKFIQPSSSSSSLFSSPSFLHFAFSSLSKVWSSNPHDPFVTGLFLSFSSCLIHFSVRSFSFSFPTHPFFSL